MPSIAAVKKCDAISTKTLYTCSIYNSFNPASFDETFISAYVTVFEDDIDRQPCDYAIYLNRYPFEKFKKVRFDCKCVFSVHRLRLRMFFNKYVDIHFEFTIDEKTGEDKYANIESDLILILPHKVISFNS